MIEKISHKLAVLAIEKEEISRENYDIYKYGFVVGIELLISIVFSILLAISFKSVLELFLFLIIFVPLRAFAGGIHLKTFIGCFFLSMFVLLSIIGIAKYGEIELLYSNIGIACLIILIKIISIIREKDMAEKQFFMGKLNLTLLGIIGLSVIFNFFRLDKWIALIFLTLVVETISLVCQKK